MIGIRIQHTAATRPHEWLQLCKRPPPPRMLLAARAHLAAILVCLKCLRVRCSAE
jgi:hypothetical protein